MESDMTANSNIHCGNEIVSNCCNAAEHKWFPLMCSDCGDFTDFLCIGCGETVYILTDAFEAGKNVTL